MASNTNTETPEQADARTKFWASLRKRIQNDPQWARRGGRL